MRGKKILSGEVGEGVVSFFVAFFTVLLGGSLKTDKQGNKTRIGALYGKLCSAVYDM